MRVRPAREEGVVMLERFNLAIQRGTRASAEWMIRKHYLGKWPGVVRDIVLLTAGSLGPVGVIVFADGPREVSKRYGGITWELARLWVDDKMPRNTESWFLSRAIKHIRKTHSEVRVLVSYADPSQGHTGTIYRAANWTPDGMTDQERKTPRFDYESIDSDLFGPKRFSRKSHTNGIDTRRVARVSKHRYIYRVTS